MPLGDANCQGLHRQTPRSHPRIPMLAKTASPHGRTPYAIVLTSLVARGLAQRWGHAISPGPLDELNHYSKRSFEYVIVPSDYLLKRTNSFVIRQSCGANFP